MNLINSLSGDIKAALKAAEKDRVRVLRSILADLRNAGIEKGATPDSGSDDPASRLDEAGQMAVLRSAVKRRKDAAGQYREGGREELAEIEEGEVEIIDGYLPAALSEEELDALVISAVAECGAEGMADMGKVMKVVMPVIDGRSDGGSVSQAVKKALG
ncbi:MAG TPA: glutamyl-tRNA amidotransferase [Planctomycetes bacterium]|nr:glutamyl-tRNA amidotransferase [Planctomycetota bacterium]